MNWGNSYYGQDIDADHKSNLTQGWREFTTGSSFTYWISRGLTNDKLTASPKQHFSNHLDLRNYRFDREEANAR